MSLASSYTVSTTSTSLYPDASISRRLASNFLAVHGMMATEQISAGSIPDLSAKYVLMSGPNISIGDLQVDRCGLSSGPKVSRYLIQPGQQDVSIGSVPPFLILPKSSVPSSMMVRSAVKSESNTLSNPRIFNALTSLPVLIVPGSSPSASARFTRTEGAT